MRSPRPFVSRLGIALGPLLCASGCGGLAADARSDGGTGASSISDAGPSPDQGAGDAEAESGAPYAGFVVASIRGYQSTPSHALDTAFWTAGNPQLSGAPNTPPACGGGAIASGPCCEQDVRHALPVGAVAPVAGNVTVSLRGVPLATLLSPAYTEIDTATWNPGDTLGVSAAGGDVAAFSGRLVTPSMTTGLSPAFGPPPVPIAHDADFRISWTPEARDGELMQLQIDAIENGGLRVVLCAVPDAAGSIVVDASLLAPLAGAQSASIHLTRSITSNVAGPNATITLEGDLWVDTLATIQ